MVQIDHIVAALDHMDKWNDYNENIVRRLLGMPEHKGGVSKRPRTTLLMGCFQDTSTGFFEAR